MTTSPWKRLLPGSICPSQLVRKSRHTEPHSRQCGGWSLQHLPKIIRLPEGLPWVTQALLAAVCVLKFIPEARPAPTEAVALQPLMNSSFCGLCNSCCSYLTSHSTKPCIFSNRMVSLPNTLSWGSQGGSWVDNILSSHLCSVFIQGSCAICTPILSLSSQCSSTTCGQWGYCSKIFAYQPNYLHGEHVLPHPVTLAKEMLAGMTWSKAFVLLHPWFMIWRRAWASLPDPGGEWPESFQPAPSTKTNLDQLDPIQPVDAKSTELARWVWPKYAISWCGTKSICAIC